MVGVVTHHGFSSRDGLFIGGFGLRVWGVWALVGGCPSYDDAVAEVMAAVVSIKVILINFSLHVVDH